MEIPILTLALAGEGIAQCLVVAFYQAIGLWIVGGGEVVLDLPFLEQLGDQIVLELQTVICLDVTGGTISAINVRIDEIANFYTSLLGKGCCFWPTGESFYCNSNEAFSLGGERKRSN